ncbi:unnamed protein product [Tilletia laevis]|uniref:Uncharacterized protein n=3 Tax=Tilletia TaxID=13289 RepID=A0A8X7MMM6_9BASI|nr:hypothetical protein CF336_g6293 [Tilletia laevis]KAE8242325.1 hypothetical protein A4X06_0g7010 [Tilletia controversa]KAE8253470.1 hypothetical protein A4X03_0g5888 [Tilletia caries]KAE8205165.1 hypothetical protein CF335_g2398 [Tilletia laevis]CAD6890644.1 unnamed protein product [Tilletia caries]
MCHAQANQVAFAHAYEKARQARPRQAAVSSTSSSASSSTSTSTSTIKAAPKSTPATLPSAITAAPTQTITAPKPLLTVGDLSAVTATLVIGQPGNGIAIPITIGKSS